MKYNIWEIQNTKAMQEGVFYWSWVVEMESYEVGEFRENTPCKGNVEGRMWGLGA